MLKHIQYPKLALLGFTVFLSYLLFKADIFHEFALYLNSHGYISVFLAGLLFAYGFTSPFAVGFFMSLAPDVNIFLAAPLAGIGAFLSDIFIFRFIRSSFNDEFEKLKLSFLFQKIHALFDRHVHDRLRPYILWTCAGFLIASPLPDEFGVSLISGFTNISQKTFSVVSFSLNTLGIFVILWLA